MSDPQPAADLDEIRRLIELYKQSGCCCVPMYFPDADALVSELSELRARERRLREAATAILPEVSCLLRQAGLKVEEMGPGHSTKRAYDALRAALSGGQTDGA